MSVVDQRFALLRPRLLECVGSLVAAMAAPTRARAEVEIAAGQLGFGVEATNGDLLFHVHLGRERWPLCAVWLADLGGYVVSDLDDRPELVLLDEPVRPGIVTCFPWPPARDRETRP